MPSTLPGPSHAVPGARVAPPAPRRALAPLAPLEQLRAGRLPRRLVQLFVGLTVMGLSIAMMIRAGLGLLPWDVLHSGVTRHLPLSIGSVIILVGVAVMLLWIPLRQLPGLGTVANALWVGVAADLALLVMPTPDPLPWQIGFMLTGVVLTALGTAMYIGSQLGPGPRDGLMTGWARATGLSLRVIRTGIEVTVVLVGWLLGGVVGLGTVLFALSIGPLTQLFLPLLIVPLRQTVTPPSVAGG